MYLEIPDRIKYTNEDTKTITTPPKLQTNAKHSGLPTMKPHRNEILSISGRFRLIQLTALLKNKPIPWSIILLQTVTGPQLVKLSQQFIVSEGSLPRSQQPAICPFFKRYILILSSYLCLGLPSCLQSSSFLIKTM